MATVNFFISGKKRDLVPVYARLSAGRGTDLIVKSGLFVNPERWSNQTQTIKQRIKTEDDETLISNLQNLKTHIEKEFKGYFGEKDKDWLSSVCDKFFNKKTGEVKNLNDFLTQFIQDAKDGKRKNKSALNLAPGTVRALEGFKRIFDDYQGIYSEKRLLEIEEDNKKRKEENKPLKKIRPLKRIDFEDINVDFYNSFINFLSDEGYQLNTEGRFVKALKMIMKKALQEKLHTNREFQYDAFRSIKEETFAIALTPEELEKMYRLDLSKPEDKRTDLARDAWFVLYETCLRVSDYNKIEVAIRTLEGKRIIDIYQTKTRRRVLIPLTARFEEIWKKYGQQLPRIPDQYINRLIKNIAYRCEIKREVRWPVVKFGKSFESTAEAWEKVSCHTARRSGATVLWKEGVPLSDIMILLGHSTEKQTREYIKISAEEAVLRLANHPHYSNGSTVLKAV